ncbi:MAG TPA: hypothetical protein VNA69_02690 [Thermoanaerobaculia bacterium]|nr:hypothetical protein [Thermoanaerobaculia bacterium]
MRVYTSSNGSDFVVLSHDFFTIAPEEIENVRVDMTIFDGKIIHERN